MAARKKATKRKAKKKTAKKKTARKVKKATKKTAKKTKKRTTKKKTAKRKVTIARPMGKPKPTYSCVLCGVEVAVSKEGLGISRLMCCGHPMRKK